jgi:succinate dehydrogenase / fumarate reductase iron-sulfur subunit
MKVEIYRYNPDLDKKPYMQTVHVDLDKHTNLIMVLDVLKLIKEWHPDLSFRHSCAGGVCGSDAININGKNCLACITPIREVAAGGKLTLRPVPSMPVVRDLVVDMQPFYEQYSKVKPYVINNSIPEDGKEYRQSADDRAKLNDLYDCVLCGCCTTACPSYWWNPDKFLGPAALLQSYRFLVDSRDTQQKERLDQLSDSFSAYRCRNIMNCTDACPKGLNPNKAIGHIRHLLLKHKIDPENISPEKELDLNNLADNLA